MAVAQAIANESTSLAANRNKFLVQRVAALNSTAGAVTIAPFDTKVFDHNSGFSTSTYKYTIPTSGYWLFQWRLGSVVAGGNRLVTILYQNGVDTTRGADLAGTTPASVGSVLLYCAAGDTIDIRYFAGAVYAFETSAVGSQFFSGILHTKE